MAVRSSKVLIHPKTGRNFEGTQLNDSSSCQSRIPYDSIGEHHGARSEDRMRQVADREHGQGCVWAGSTREVCGGDASVS